MKISGQNFTIADSHEISKRNFHAQCAGVKICTSAKSGSLWDRVQAMLRRDRPKGPRHIALEVVIEKKMDLALAAEVRGSRRIKVMPDIDLWAAFDA